MFNIGGLDLLTIQEPSSFKNTKQYFNQIVEALRKYGDGEGNNGLQILKKARERAKEDNIQKLQEGTNIVGNITYSDLQSKYPNFIFPKLTKGIDSKAPSIRLVNSAKIDGESVYGKVTTSDGRTVYIVPNNFTGVRDFAAAMILKEALDKNSKLDGIEFPSELLKLGSEVRADKKIFKTAKGLIDDYIANPSLYKRPYDVEAVKFELQLDKVLKRMIGDYSTKIDYNNDFVNAVNNLLQNKDSIELKKLLGLYNSYAEQEGLEKVGKDDYKALQFQVSKIYEDNKYGYNIVKFTKNSVVFKKSFQSYESLLNLHYLDDGGKQLVKHEDTYKGYNIYSCITNRVNKFFISRTLFNMKRASTTPYESLEVAKSQIDKRAATTRINAGLSEQFFMNSDEVIKQVRTHDNQMSYQKGDIIAVPNITMTKPMLSSLRNILNSTAMITIDNFTKALNITNDEVRNYVKDNITSPTQAYAMLCALSERLQDEKLVKTESRDQAIRNAAEQVVTSNTHYYMCTKKTKAYKFNDKITFFRKLDPRYGIHKGINIEDSGFMYNSNLWMLNQVADYLKTKFGLNVEVLTADKINEKFGEEGETLASAKAFIRDGVIYVNQALATDKDMLHEYTHILLGALKSVNMDAYENLMNEYMDRGLTQKRIAELSKNPLYEGLSQVDLAEESFADGFGDYLRTGEDAAKIFTKAKVLLQSTLGISDITTTSMLEIAKKNSKEPEVVTPFDVNNMKIQGKITNYIKELISDNKIQQNCG